MLWKEGTLSIAARSLAHARAPGIGEKPNLHWVVIILRPIQRTSPNERPRCGT